jgi:hypothetical protein
VSITNLEPVPVWLAIAVALPVDVIGPVKFALVATVAAVKLATVVVDVTENGAVPVAIVEINCVPDIVDATISFFAIPTPPATISAAFDVDVASVCDVNVAISLTVAPCLTTKSAIAIRSPFPANMQYLV